jgi:hypothetical protein
LASPSFVHHGSSSAHEDSHVRSGFLLLEPYVWKRVSASMG